jgi:TPR repeat protein
MYSVLLDDFGEFDGLAVTENGVLVPQSFDEIEEAAKQGDIEAQGWLGFCYRHGKGVPQNIEKALYFYQIVAEQGDLTAQYQLGVMYQDGNGVPQSFAKALYYFQLAAGQGDAKSCTVS